MSDLSAPKPHTDPAARSFSEELGDVLALEDEISFGDHRPELHFFQGRWTVRMSFLFLLIPISADINDTDHGRGSIRGHLNQVETGIFSSFECLDDG